MLSGDIDGSHVIYLIVAPACQLAGDLGALAVSAQMAVNQCVHTEVLVVLHIYGNFRAFLDILGADTQNDLFASVRSKCALLFLGQFH